MSTFRSNQALMQLVREMNYRVGAFLWPAVVLLTLLGLWEVLVPIYGPPSYILPTPSEIGVALVENYPTIFGELLTTLSVFTPAYLATLFSGYMLGLVMSQWKVMETVLYPYVIVARTIPVVALIPIIILWLGFGASSIVMISYLISFFAMVVNTLAGFKATDDELIDMLRSFSATRWELFRNVYVYASLPLVFAGMKICVILAFTGVIVGEFLVSMEGIGYLIMEYNYNLASAKMFAAILTISVTQLLLFGAVVALERKVVSWQ